MPQPFDLELRKLSPAPKDSNKSKGRALYISKLKRKQNAPHTLTFHPPETLRALLLHDNEDKIITKLSPPLLQETL